MGVPDVLVFSNWHADVNDLISDMERVVAQYGGILDKRGVTDF